MEHKGKRISKYVKDYVVFDLETTGISPVHDEIIELSAVKVRDHQPGETFSRLVNPKRPIPGEATKVNGITDEMVREAPGLEAVLPEFLDFIEGEILVGHNIQSFDLIFLSRKVEWLGAKPLPNDFIDTLYMARTCLPQLSRHRLVDLAKHFKVSTTGAHRALNDCLMNQLCYEHMGALWAQVKVMTCAKCGGEMVRRKGKFGEFYGCSNYPVCRHTQKIS